METQHIRQQTEWNFPDLESSFCIVMRRVLIMLPLFLLNMSACGPLARAPEAATDDYAVETDLDSIQTTDPSMVVLASGKPQLIEFFAFW
jgi:hypothetical protein